MHEAGDRLEAEHRARALDRVKGAEGAIDQLLIGGPFGEVEQNLFELLKQLPGFLAKGGGGIGVCHAPATFLMTARS